MNLSRTGAMVLSGSPPKVGQDVVLKCATIDAFGVVIWSGNGRCGVHFDEALSTADVIAMRQAGDDRLRTGVTPEQRQAAQDWVEGRLR